MDSLPIGPAKHGPRALGVEALPLKSLLIPAHIWIKLLLVHYIDKEDSERLRSITKRIHA